MQFLLMRRQLLFNGSLSGSGCQVPSVLSLRERNSGTFSLADYAVEHFGAVRLGPASDSEHLTCSSVEQCPSNLVVCRYASWSWLNEATGEVREFNCGSWRCPVHRSKVAFRWACRVAESKPERMITLTNLPVDRARAYRAFDNLRCDIREHYEFEYARFLEVGAETGMLHWHLAQRGDYIPQAWLSRRAAAHGLGEVVDIRRCYGKGPSFYLAKYITKEAAPEGWRKVTVSRGYPKAEPVVSTGDWILRRGV